MAPLSRRLLLLLGAAVVAGVICPLFAGGPDLDQAALALALAAPAAGVAVAASAGRPLLAGAALAGVGAYCSGMLAGHGVAVPVAIVCGAGAGTAAGAVIAALGAALDGPALLLATLVAAVTAGDVVQALPSLTGAQSGLGPLPPISVPLGSSHTVVLTPIGNFHVLLAIAVVSMGIAAVLLERGPGVAWRALGSDRGRAIATGVRPAVAETTVCAGVGLLAALSGAAAAHVSGSADPAAFAVDVAALSLLAALAGGRHPITAGLLAVATGLAGRIVLPSLGWHGPPSAQSLALGVLAIGAVFTLVPGGGATEPADSAAVDPDSPWPLEHLRRGAVLEAPPLQVRARGGRLLLDAPSVSAEPGRVTAIVGPNGAGKTTWLRAVAARARQGEAPVEGGLELLPQTGGGFSQCTARETLELAAARGGQDAAAAGRWLDRLGLSRRAGLLCGELSAGERRLLDLARALLTAPGVLMLDEPLAGLDEVHRAAATACLRAAAAAGGTVVLSEHDHEAVAALQAQVVELEPQ